MMHVQGLVSMMSVQGLVTMMPVRGLASSMVGVSFESAPDRCCRCQ